MQHSLDHVGPVAAPSAPSYSMVAAMGPPESGTHDTFVAAVQAQRPAIHSKPVSVYEVILPSSIGWCKHSSNNRHSGSSNGNGIMPLVHHLKHGFESGRPFAWHRQEERQARELPLVVSFDADLEDWERELAWTEILVLSGSSDQAFVYLARAWGRDDGFHLFLSQYVGVASAVARSNRNSRHMPPAASASSVVAARQQQIQQHHQHGTGMDVLANGGGPSDPLTADSFDFSGELFFEDLDQEMESLSSGGEDENEGFREDDEREQELQEQEQLFCKPCREAAV